MEVATCDRCGAQGFGAVDIFAHRDSCNAREVVAWRDEVHARERARVVELDRRNAEMREMLDNMRAEWEARTGRTLVATKRRHPAKGKRRPRPVFTYHTPTPLGCTCGGDCE